MDVSYPSGERGEGAGCVWEVGGREAGSMFVVFNVRQELEKSSHPDVF